MQVLFETVFGAPWWLIIATAVYGVCWTVYGDLYKDGRANRRWVADLRGNAWLAWYRRVLGEALDRVDGWLSQEGGVHSYPPRAFQIAWSGSLMNLMLLLAVAYPMLGVLGQWGLLGVDGRIGPLVVIEGGQPLWQRIVLLSLCSVSFLAFHDSLHAQSARRLLVAAAAASLVFAGAIVSDVLFAAAAALAFTGAVFGAVAGLGAFEGTIAGSVAAAGAIVGAYASAGVVSGQLAYSAAIIASGAGAGAGAVALAIANRRTGELLDRPALAKTLYLVALLAALYAATAALDDLRASEADAVRTLMLFLGVLPVVNALADFLSTGLTRYTLRRGLAPAARVWLWGALDVAGGLAILLLLGFALIAWVAFVRLPDGSAVVDLAALFVDLRANPNDYWWLYLMLFTTLLPTALHLLFASFGGVLQLWPWLRDHIADGLEAGAAGDAVLGRWAVQWLCLAMTVSVMAPVMVTGLLWVNAGAIGLGFLDLFEGFAALLGAV